MLKANIDGFIQLVENGKFVEAHEVLEEDWKLLKKQGEREKAKYLQALINGATALALYVIKKRPDPALRVWEVYLKNRYLFDQLDIYEKEKYFQTQYLLETLYEKRDTL